MRLIILGLPGAGKGTQGQLLEKRFNTPHISTGSMFRGALQNGVPEAEAAQEYIVKGNLVPDELAIEIVRHRLSREDCENGYILEGFPRNLSQAHSLDGTLADLGHHLSAVVNLRISGEEAVRRIVNRRTCSKCQASFQQRFLDEQDQDKCPECGGKLIKRSDDTKEVALHRLKVYRNETHPLVGFYEDKGLLVNVDGEQEIETTYNQLIGKLKSFANTAKFIEIQGAKE